MYGSILGKNMLDELQALPFEGPRCTLITALRKTNAFKYINQSTCKLKVHN